MEFDETKPEPIVAPDTNNRTRFNYEEAPDEYRLGGTGEHLRWHYKLLKRMNDGTHVRSWTNPYEMWTDDGVMRRIDNLAVYDAISSQMDMPTSLKRWGRKLFSRLDMRSFSRRNETGKGVVKAAVCVCAYVCWRKGWKTHPNHPKKHEKLTDILADLEISESEFRKYYGRLENETRRAS